MFVFLSELTRWKSHCCVVVLSLVPGDIDEIMMFSALVSTTNIGLIYRGDFFTFNPLTPSNNCKLWLRFNEGAGNQAVDSCQGITANTATWNGAALWKPNTDTPICIDGYHTGWRVVLATSSVRVGTTVQVRIHMIDQWNVSMSTYAVLPGASSVSIKQIGGTGTALSTSFISVPLTGGTGVVNMTDNKVESITFQLSDTGSTGRSTAISSPRLIWYAGDVSSLTITALGVPVTFTPAFVISTYVYLATAIPYGAVNINVRAVFTQTSSMHINGGLDIGLTSGVDAEISTNQGVNTLEIFSQLGQPGDYTYTIAITRKPPDVTDIILSTTPPLTSVTPAFVQADFTGRVVVVPGFMTELKITVKFGTPGSLTVTLNGAPIVGTVQNNTPFDLSSLIIPEQSNLLQIGSNQDGGSWSYQISPGQ
jgi:hypothetical protein